jgi:hypothetical protein
MTFRLNEKEVENFNKFKDEQLLKHRREGTFEFRFVPTGIALAIYAKNRDTGEECNISDYDSW